MNLGTEIWPFVLSAFAVWRLTHLFAREDGPWDLIVRLRSWLGSAFLGRLMDCFYCLSLWFSFPLAVWITRLWLPMIVNWLALSGAACLLEKFSSRQDEPSFPRVEMLTEPFPKETFASENFPEEEFSREGFSEMSFAREEFQGETSCAAAASEMR